MKPIIVILGIFVCLSLTSCTGCSSHNESDTSYLDVSNYELPIEDEYAMAPQEAVDNRSIQIPYTEMAGNTITIPVKINGMGLEMIFDTGASSTCITLAEAQYLYEKSSLTENDIIDLQPFQTADGAISTGLRIILRSVAIGDKIKLYNIEALVVENQQAPLLLGQSVMKKFREISVDRENKVVKFFE